MSIAHSIKDTVRTDDVLITESVDFSGLLLSKHVLQGLTEAGFKRPSPIQLKAIPLGRCGLDLIVQAKSGTGKTCVFTVVALEGLEVKSVCVQVLVLAPTREIAIQIQDVIQTIGKPMKGLKCHAFIGGLPLEADKNAVRSCHIAVGTPGRVKQLIEIGAMKTNNVRMFVLDEADKLLEEGFQETINWIYASLPQNKQILALSATYPEQLAQHLTSYMRNPTFVRLNTTDPALLGIKQYHFVVANHPMPNVVFNSKIEAVVKILSSVSFQQCLIFSNLQTGAQNLQSELLSQNWPTTCIAGFLGQKERNLAMEQLKTYKCRILISTDLTSRGIDADKVNLVINLDVPLDHETYLHRIGRAGRFGSFGAAITIVTKGAQETQLWAVEKKCHTYIHKLPDPIPNDLVTKPVPLKIDNIVSTEQIITQPTLEISAAEESPSIVASNPCLETLSSSDAHMVTQLSDRDEQTSEEKLLVDAETNGTGKDETLIDVTQTKALLAELPDKHVSDTESVVVAERNCDSVLEPSSLLSYETGSISGDSHSMSGDSHSIADAEFTLEILSENSGKYKCEISAEEGDKIPTENGDNCELGVKDAIGNDSYETLKGNCNECEGEKSAGVFSNCTRSIGPDDNLETVNGQGMEEKSSVNCNGETPELQISFSTLNEHDDLAHSVEDIDDRCIDLETRLEECLETSHHESIIIPESDSHLASLEIEKCEVMQLLAESKTNNVLENSETCEPQHHSITEYEETCGDILCIENKRVLPADTREENKDGIIKNDNSECNNSVNIDAELTCLSVDDSVNGDDLTSDKALIACSDNSSETASNVKCNTNSHDEVVSVKVVSSLTTVNAEKVSNRDNPIHASVAPALVIPEKGNHSKPSGETAQTESNAKVPNNSQQNLPVKFRKTGTRRSYLKPFALTDFLKFVNESNSCPHSEDSSYSFNNPDEECNGDGIISSPDVSASVQDSVTSDLNGGGDFIPASNVVLTGQPSDCGISPNEKVVNENNELCSQHLNVFGGGDSLCLNLAGDNYVDSVSCPSGFLEKSVGKSEMEVLDVDMSISHKCVVSLGQHVELIQSSSVENDMSESKNRTIDESACNSLPQSDNNFPATAPSEVLHKSANILLKDCLSSILLSSQPGSQVTKFADLEADYEKFCSDFDDSTAISYASELMANIVLEDFEETKDVQKLCAVEWAKLALLKSNLKAKLLNAAEKRKGELSLEARLQLNQKVEEKSEQYIDEAASKKQKTKPGYKGKNKSGRGRKGSDSMNWRSAADENYQRPASDGHRSSPRKDTKKQKGNSTNLNEITWKRNTQDGPTYQKQLSEEHVEKRGLLGKFETGSNKLNQHNDSAVAENTQKDDDENTKKAQMKPSDKEDDECNMLDNMHAQMLLKRKQRKLEKERLSGGEIQSHSITTEVTNTENTKAKDNERVEEVVEPSEHRDGECKVLDVECKVLDDMHVQMLLNRKLKKLERQQSGCGNVQSNSYAAEKTELNNYEAAKIKETIDKDKANLTALTHREKTSGCKAGNPLQENESSVNLNLLSKESKNYVCKENLRPDSNHEEDDSQTVETLKSKSTTLGREHSQQKSIQRDRPVKLRLDSDPEIKENQVAENLMSRSLILSRGQSRHKGTEREKQVKFKPASDSPSSDRKPTKPSKTEARLAGLEVSDGSTSSTSDLSLSSASDISDVNSSDEDTKDIIMASQCYANKYAQEGNVDLRCGKPNKKEITRKALCPHDDNSHYSASFLETERLQHNNYSPEVSLVPRMSTMSLQDSHSTDNYPYSMHYPITEAPLHVKSGSKSNKLKYILPEQNHERQQQDNSSSSRRNNLKEHHKANNTLAKDHRLSRKSRQNHEDVRHSGEFTVSDSEVSSSDSSRSDSHSFMTHNPSLYSYNTMPWFSPYCNMHQSLPQPVYPTSPYFRAMQQQTHYGPQCFHPSYSHPALYQSSQAAAYSYPHVDFYQRGQLSAHSYPQPAFQWYTPSSQMMWYYVSHMTNMLSQLTRKHKREMERLSREE